VSRCSHCKWHGELLVESRTAQVEGKLTQVGIPSGQSLLLELGYEDWVTF
jgi:hypothetical protein